MNDPHFDQAFWQDVHRRAGQVRELAAQELERAEQLVLAGQSEPCAALQDAQVVPVFTEPFWNHVGHRAHKVRQMAMSSVAEAQGRLVGGDVDLQGETVPVPAGRMRRLAGRLSLQRSDAFGLAAALVAVLLFLPQIIAPVWSSAGLEPPKILSYVVFGDDNKQPVPQNQQQKPGGEEGSTRSSGSSASARGAAGTPDGTPSAGSGGQSSRSFSGENGLNGASSDQNGAPGQNGAGASGASGLPPAPSSPVPPGPAAPSAPSGLTAVAVDPTSIRLTWTDNSTDETGFLANRTRQEGAEGSTRAVDRDVTTLLWTGLAPQTQACFRVRAVNQTAGSDWAPSAEPGQICVTTPSVETTPSAQPSPAAPQSPPGTQSAAPPPPS